MEKIDNFIYGKAMKWLYAAAYALCLFSDLRFIIKWMSYGEMEDVITLFVLLMIFHLIFLILAIVWHARGRAARGSILLLFILGCFALMSVSTANSMAKYIYKSRYGTYDRTIEDFKQNAIMKVTSNSLNGSRWPDEITNTEAGQNLSPQLSFDEVAGAEYYVIYMVDESANNWVHWYAEVSQTDLNEGENPGQYIGPYPPAGSGDHTYTIYVYALKGKPDFRYEGEFPEFDETWFGADTLWAGFLNVEDGSTDPVRYGNVIAYGYISGTYSR